ncbi:AAA family ATPase [Aquabacterium sp. A08]|uniref:AAA family ATPase n=1 Tax=Aquabacterium sp. A08 TaxID=2718532 RepID=UPI001FB9A25F|nr:AAA family ATPase [Aquabacterium sp. A08]
MSAAPDRPAALPDWAAALAALEHGLLQRDVAARCLLLATLAGEHLLLLGPPGTAKSELARRLHRRLPGTRYFERLLTRFTVPEELFGPLSLRALEDDRYERLTDGYLPQAEVAFLDEVFKANSAILNTLLGLLHERQFDNGTLRQPVPLLCLVGASNEWPQDDGLQAFYDRFLLRVPVAPVDDAHFHALLLAPPPTPADAPSATGPGALHPAELDALRAQAQAVELPADVLDRLRQARQRCRDQDTPVSDRRWRQLAGLLKVQAASRGDRAVNAWDLWVLPFVLPHRPDDTAAWAATFFTDVAQAEALDTTGLQAAVDAFEGQLDIERRTPADGPDDSAGKLALAQALAGPSGDSEMLRLVSDRAHKRYSAGHVASRVAQLDGLCDQIDALCVAVSTQADAVTAAARAHPWLPPSWCAHIAAVHGQRRAQAQALQAQAHGVRAGFAALPVDPASTEPEPIAPPEGAATLPADTAPAPRPTAP